MGGETDVLLKCEGDTLLELASRLKEDIPFSASAHNTLLLHHRGYSKHFTFFRLRHHQESHVIVYTDQKSSVGLFCKKDELQLLQEALKKTRILDWNSSLFFYHVIDYIVPIVRDIALSLHELRTWETVCHVFVFDVNTDVKIKARDDANIKLLGRTGVKMMYDAWRYNSCLPEEEVQQQCLHMPAVGVYLPPDPTESANDSSTIDLDRIVRAPDEDLPVSWTSMASTGSLGLLETQKEHKRKGFGSMIVQACAMLMVKEGYFPHAHVDKGNGPSIGLFEKLEGWRASHTISWVGFRSK